MRLGKFVDGYGLWEDDNLDGMPDRPLRTKKDAKRALEDEHAADRIEFDDSLPEDDRMEFEEVLGEPADDEFNLESEVDF